jgi:ribosomal protein S8
LGTEGHRFKSCLADKNRVWPNGMATAFGAVNYGFESYYSKKEKKEMEKSIGNRRRRRNQGYRIKREKVTVKETGKKIRSVRKRRTEEGYVLGYKRKKENGKKVGIEIKRRYGIDGIGARTEGKRRSKESRKRTSGYRERWGRTGERGRYRRDTTEGRRKDEVARKKKRGGKRVLWVS